MHGRYNVHFYCLCNLVVAVTTSNDSTGERRKCSFLVRAVLICLPIIQSPFFLLVYKELNEAVKKHPEASVMVNFASLRSAPDATLETLKHPQVCGSFVLSLITQFSYSLPDISSTP